jgi:UDP-GlcNAc:undecaprenyl-phosphate/decaprenyl-phosphate GlcNAc-1-phosphate transferase
MEITTQSLIIIYLSSFSVASVFAILLNGLFLNFIKNLGIRNNDEKTIRWSAQAKPAIGGISFFIIFLLSISAYSFLFPNINIFQNIKFLGIIVSTTLAFLLGLADDAYNTKPFLKFSIQILCGVILVLTGSYINFFESIYLNGFLTVFWVIGVMNSINMLDNMDAITTVVSKAIFLAILIISFSFKPATDVFNIICVGGAASMFGFLFYNWNPAKIYMGDTGSMFLGCLLAALAINNLWNHPIAMEQTNILKQSLLAVIVFILPITDTTTVSINRILRGQSPFVGGKDHTTHHLYYMGLKERQIALLYFAIGIISALLVYYLYKIENWTLIQYIISIAYILLIFVPLYSVTKIYSKKS